MNRERVTGSHEHERLEAVRRYAILDTPPDGAFDRITSLAARHFDVPIAIASIVDRDRIWFKSHHGIDVQEIDREHGMCASAILQHGPWLLENAAVDPRTLANPLVAGELGLRFYAGVPLTTQDGFNLGTLCVIDQQPRQLSERDVDTLRDLGAIVREELELRLAAQHAVERELELRDQAERVARSLRLRDRAGHPALQTRPPRPTLTPNLQAGPRRRRHPSATRVSDGPAMDWEAVELAETTSSPPTHRPRPEDAPSRRRRAGARRTLVAHLLTVRPPAGRPAVRAFGRLVRAGSGRRPRPPASAPARG